MNYKEKILQYQKNLEILDLADRRNTGSVRFGEIKFSHYIMKCIYAWDLKNRGEKIITEAKTKDGKGRIDLYSITTGQIYEFETDPKEDKKRGIRIQVPNMWRILVQVKKRLENEN